MPLLALLIKLYFLVVWEELSAGRSLATILYKLFSIFD